MIKAADGTCGGGCFTVIFVMVKLLTSVTALNIEMVIDFTSTHLSYNLWFCVCLFVGHGPYLVRKKGAHVHLEGWKHGNGEVRLNKVCTQ